MKYRIFHHPVLPLLLFAALYLSSCASRPGIINPPETGTAAAMPEETISSFDRAVLTVKRNSGAVTKFFQFSDDAEITVKGEISERDSSDEAEFTVEYDLKNSRQTAAYHYEVDFIITETATGKTRQDTLLWFIRDDGAGLLLSFDDDYMDSWRRYFDLLDAYSARVTFFVQGTIEEIPDDSLNNFCIEARERGHDIGYHSAHHLDLTKLSRIHFFRETSLAAEAFEKSGIGFSSFAYPYGFWQPWMNEELQPRFGILRGYGVTFRLYSAEMIRDGFITSKAIDNIVYKDEELFYSDLTMMLKTAKFLDNVAILPLTTHDISEDAKWGIKPDRLENLLKTANELRLKFYRYCDF
jgi:peptidoglycan/xylan/chitin deacetylase (PgdA/CDA1 family)